MTIKNENRCIPTVLGVGCFGVGKYTYNKDLYVYKAWSHMITRCYDHKYSDKFPTYKNCLVDEYFLNFQNFAEWYYNNIWIDDGKSYLDKDILVKGNKIYSPETCVLVDNFINCIFTKGNKARGKYPIGVSVDNRTNTPRAYLKGIDGSETTKYCKTVEDAFYTYKEFKESCIKQVADNYKQKYPNFPQKLYDAMYEYEVEITD